MYTSMNPKERRAAALRKLKARIDRATMEGKCINWYMSESDIAYSAQSESTFAYDYQNGKRQLKKAGINFYLPWAY